ncbi:MAG: lipid-A-disaccharide synthase [Bacteroidales bacterium]|nr:lipid-A-disaccharide synthase [Bacteroidales bacterium]
MKYYIITGEASGDLHASNLVKELLALDPCAIIRAWGGSELKKLPINVVKELHELNFMGLVEVLAHIRTIRKNFQFAYTDILSFKPDVLILVDFPGFNLRLARWAKKNGVRVFYYISPTVWAWHKSRIKTIQQFVDKMFVILPFEQQFYKQYGIEVDYEGHPILDALEQHINKPSNFQQFYSSLGFYEKPIIAILPGSRKQEVRKLLPTMLTVANQLTQYQFVVCAISSLPKSLYDPATHIPNVTVVYDKTYEILKHAHAAIVKSGTSTLETALFKVPQVVCYATNPITYYIARQLVSVKYISLVNLLLNKEVVKELIQNNFNKQCLISEVEKLFIDEHRQQILTEYENLIQLLKGGGCSHRIAQKMIDYLKQP